MIYLDNAATTPLEREVFEEMVPFLTTNYGNPGATYSIGREAAKAVQHAREQVAKFLNTEPEHIIFTSGGSEANNLVIKGVAPYLESKQRCAAITSSVEHESVLKAFNDLQKGNEREGVINRWNIIKVSYDDSTVKQCEEILKGHGDVFSPCSTIGIVSIMDMNNETGKSIDTLEIAKLCQRYGTLCHIDAVQSSGYRRIFADNYDFVSISGHKFGAPKGIGALAAKNKTILTPLISGGSIQEFGYRGGTENVASIVGLGKACELREKTLTAHAAAVDKERNDLIKAIMAAANEENMRDKIALLSPAEYGKIISLHIQGVDAGSLVLMLDSQGVCVSSGSACSAHENTPSHVLLAEGLSPEEARQVIRISLSGKLTDEEIIEASRKIIQCAKALTDINNSI